MRRKGKRGSSLLTENIIFIVLNLMFLTILMLFISQQGNGVIVLEQSYAKQIALVIDSAKPGMDVFLDFEKGFDKIKKEYGDDYVINKDTIKQFVQIEDNTVTVKLTSDKKRKGYSYSYFNDIDFDILIDIREDRQGLAFNFR